MHCIVNNTMEDNVGENENQYYAFRYSVVFLLFGIAALVVYSNFIDK